MLEIGSVVLLEFTAFWAKQIFHDPLLLAHSRLSAHPEGHCQMQKGYENIQRV